MCNVRKDTNTIVSASYKDPFVNLVCVEVNWTIQRSNKVRNNATYVVMQQSKICIDSICYGQLVAI